MTRAEALKGSFVHDSGYDSGNGAGNISGKFAGFYVPDGGATIDRIEKNGDSSTNVLTEYIKTTGGVAAAGVTIMADEEDYISLVSLTAGSVNPINFS